MGFAPPVDAPPPVPGVSVDASLGPGPTAAELCGQKFKFPPSLNFSFGFVVPAIPFPPTIPLPHLSIALSCSADNPLAIHGDWGGGRSSNADPDPDLQEQAQA